jgi:hypothetical protein
MVSGDGTGETLTGLKHRRTPFSQATESPIGFTQGGVMTM